MIYIPLGKALAAVETDSFICAGCFFNRSIGENCPVKGILECSYERRPDHKDVVFKLVDYEGEKK